MKNSPNINIRDLWGDTINKNIIPDSLLISNTLKDALKIVSKDQQNSASNHLAGLPYQGLSIKSLIDNIAKNNIT